MSEIFQEDIFSFSCGFARLLQSHTSFTHNASECSVFYINDMWERSAICAVPPGEILSWHLTSLQQSQKAVQGNEKSLLKLTLAFCEMSFVRWLFLYTVSHFNISLWHPHQEAGPQELSVEQMEPTALSRWTITTFIVLYVYKQNHIWTVCVEGCRSLCGVGNVKHKVV